MERILFVDDEENLRFLFMKVFEDRGFDLETASNFEEAMTKMRHKPFDVIISDINMPGKSGLALLHDIKGANPEANVILITGNPSVESAADAVRNGAFDYLTKPFNIGVLEEVITKALHKKRALDERHRLKLIEDEYVTNLEDTLQQQTQEIRKAYKFLERAHQKSLEILATAVDYRDDDTGNHVIRIGGYSTLLAEKLGLSAQSTEILRNAAPMHDVGKIGIPDAILQKPGKLTSEEFEIMKQHTVIGAKIFLKSEHPYHIASGIIALTHHEKWDGSGYPRGLAGDEIHIFGRIVAIVDVFDALTNDRVYKKAWTDEKALELISGERGKHFDPEITRIFVDNFDRIREIRQNINLDGPGEHAVSLEAFNTQDYSN